MGLQSVKNHDVSSKTLRQSQFSRYKLGNLEKVLVENEHSSKENEKKSSEPDNDKFHQLYEGNDNGSDIYDLYQ